MIIFLNMTRPWANCSLAPFSRTRSGKQRRLQDARMPSESRWYRCTKALIWNWNSVIGSDLCRISVSCQKTPATSSPTVMALILRWKSDKSFATATSGVKSVDGQLGYYFHSRSSDDAHDVNVSCHGYNDLSGRMQLSFVQKLSWNFTITGGPVNAVP